MNVRHFRSLALALTLPFIALSGCLARNGDPLQNAKVNPQNPTNVVANKPITDEPIALGADEALVTILGTNDIHGAIEPKTMPKGDKLGGMAFWAGVVHAIRDGVTARYGNKGGVLLVDGGDQFQGTLLSNYSEGELMFSLFEEAGYDAIAPGNHDYDFGPIGWLVDQVTPGEKGDPRGVIKKLASSVNFPMLSANAYMKASLKQIDGSAATVKNVNCESKDPLDWSKAERPEFLKPYIIKNVAGVRVAIVGLDNPTTPDITTIANVSDLCFRPALAEYQSIRTELEGQADVFLIVIHDGDIITETTTQTNLTNLLKGIQAWRKDGVDAIVGGHTHMVNNVNVDGVYAIQSGANGERFGRIDLIVNTKTKKVDRTKTRVAAGALMLSEGCDPQINFFCAKGLGAKITYEKQEVNELASAKAMIAKGEDDIRPMISRVLGHADREISKNYDTEGELPNFLTDVLRKASATDVSIINAGGVRTVIPVGTFTYERLFAILPFNNHAVVLPMKVSSLVKVFDMASKSCGKHGAVLASGLRITYNRDCKKAVDGEDPTGGLVTMALNDGSVLYDARDPANIKMNEQTLRVATLDYLETGGSGYTAFLDAKREKDLGLFREILADELAKKPDLIDPKIDDRFKDIN